MLFDADKPDIFVEVTDRTPLVRRLCNQGRADFIGDFSWETLIEEIKIVIDDNDVEFEDIFAWHKRYTESNPVVALFFM